MKYIYVRNGVVVHVSKIGSEPVDGAVVVGVQDAEVVENGHLYDGTTFSAPIVPGATVISVPEFLLRFSSNERVATRNIRDAVEDSVVKDKINDFMLILEDPRTQVVHLNIAPTIDGVTYVINAIKIAVSYTQEQADTRIAQILS